MTPTRINLWSGPRNVSTAMMYSFAQRADTTVVDEPLYAHYLIQTGLVHPGRKEVLSTQQHTAEEVIRDVLLGEYATPVAFFKQMAHHLVNLDERFMKYMKNVLLIRDPKYVIHSFAKVIPEPTLQDIGIARQWKLFQDLQAMGDTPCILDSMYFLQHPEKVLTKLCEEYLDIPFD
ncbi:MAG: sulfotransferase family protein, partial [Bacteroidota bacterium]